MKHFFKNAIFFAFIFLSISIQPKIAFATEITTPTNNISKEIIQEKKQNIFNDINEKDWYYNYIIEMYEKGIVKGKEDGNFHPNDNVTIGEYCTMLCRALDADVVFSEEENHWAYSYYRYIKENGAWKTSLNFNTLDDGMQRKKAIEISLRAFGYKFPVAAKYLENPFVDIEKENIPTQNYIVNAYHLNIISGNKNGEAMPNEIITRAQACKIISNILKTDLTEPLKPEILNKIKIELKGNYSNSFYSDICYGIECFEESVVESLYNNAKIIITDEHQSKYLTNTNIEASGCFLSDNTIVCFTKGNYSSLLFGIGSTLRHEIGHYIYNSMLTNEEKLLVKNSFNSEKDMDVLKKATRSNYCETNIQEYFAEFTTAYSKRNIYNNLNDMNQEMMNLMDKYIK